MTIAMRNIIASSPVLTKIDPAAPVFVVTGPRSLAIRAGTVVDGHVFSVQAPVSIGVDGAHALAAGRDYGVAVVGGVARAYVAGAIPAGEGAIGGFHVAPGGNATAHHGGDAMPAINPCSLWDINFRPACPDPRGMALIDGPGRPFWCDIYLTAARHLANGTSTFGAVIADHNDRPDNPAGAPFKRFDYPAAVAVMAHHGKQLLTRAEFECAADGVTEHSANSGDPKLTGLDAPRTSRFGLMQATGNMWVWGRDADGLQPRASFFGGSWWSGGHAGSRRAVVDFWAGYSVDDLGARGRSDHLQPV